MMDTYDFSCWVIKYDRVSVRGLIYQKDSLKNNDNIVVPLCWNHDHYSSNNVLGSVLLEHREGEGIYAYCTLWDNRPIFKENVIKLLRDKGSVALSPFISRVKYDKNYVTSGVIQEVSLVPERIDPDECYYPVLKEEY